MRPLLKQLIRAVIIGLVLGGIVFWWVRRNAEMKRINEVRSRVMPRLKEELRSHRLELGDPVFIRIFKESREAEVWLKPHNESQFKHWRTFPIVAMSGKLGPKLVEGDAQTPEGFYEVNTRALNPNSAFHLSFNIGYPNEFDRNHNRTGSWIMMHGGQASVGCFAMSDPSIEEIYLIAEAALQHGQPLFAVHVFPFRMTEERMRTATTSEWLPFWENLREGYLKFEDTRVPPVVRADGDRYAF